MTHSEQDVERVARAIDPWIASNGDRVKGTARYNAAMDTARAALAAMPTPSPVTVTTVEELEALKKALFNPAWNAYVRETGDELVDESHDAFVAGFDAGFQREPLAVNIEAGAEAFFEFFAEATEADGAQWSTEPELVKESFRIAFQHAATESSLTPAAPPVTSEVTVEQVEAMHEHIADALATNVAHRIREVDDGEDTEYIAVDDAATIVGAALRTYRAASVPVAGEGAW